MERYTAIAVGSDSIGIAPKGFFGFLPYKSGHAITHLAGVSGFTAKVKVLTKLGRWHPSFNASATDANITSAETAASRTQGRAHGGASVVRGSTGVRGDKIRQRPKITKALLQMFRGGRPKAGES